MRLVRFIISVLIVLSLLYSLYYRIPTKRIIEWSATMGKMIYLIYPFAFLILFLVVDTLLSRFLNLLDKTFSWIIGIHYRLPGKENKENRLQAKRAVYALLRFRYQEAARYFFNAGLSQQAAICFEKIHDSSSAAEAYYSAREYPKAAEMLKRAGKLESAAECYIKLGDRESAMKCYDAAGKKLLLEGKNVLAAEAYLKAKNYGRAGELLEKSGHTQRAAEAFEKAGDSLRTADLYLQTAREQSLRIIQHHPQPLLPSLNIEMIENAKKAGELFLDQGNYEKAVEAFDLTGDTEKTAEIYKSKGDFSEAAKIYEKAELWTKAQQCYERLGSQKDILRMEAHLALKNKQLQRAAMLFEELGDFQQALEIYKSLRDAAGQAHCLEKLGRPLAAAQYYAKGNNLLKAAELFELYGDYSKAAEIYHELGLLQQASKCISKSNNLLYAALLERKKGNLDNAIEILRTMSHQTPDYQKAMLFLAQCYMDKDQTSLAADVFDLVIPSLIPNLETIENFHLYGCALEKTENYQHALEIFKKVQNIQKDYKDIGDRIKDIEKRLSIKSKLTLQNLTNRPFPSPLEVSPHTIPPRVSDQKTKMEDHPTVLEAPATISENRKTILQDQMTSIQGPPSAFYDQKTIFEKYPHESGKDPSMDIPDRFQKLERIGKPSSRPGSVLYKARDRNSGKIVAFKVLPFSFWKSPAEKSLFLEQFPKVSRLQHPHIVPIIETGEMKNEFYISMEYCGGGNLQELIEHEGRLPPREALPLFQRLTEALAYAHNNNIIHGNIKPNNILFTDKGSPKINDFAFRHLLSETAGSKGFLDSLEEEKKFQVLSYISPEQIRGEPPGKSSDIYSLGLILFFMLAAQSPIDLMGRITPEEIMDAHLYGSFPFPGKIFKDLLPKEMDELFLACTRKDPEKRIQREEEILRLIQIMKENSG